MFAPNRFLVFWFSCSLVLASVPRIAIGDEVDRLIAECDRLNISKAPYEQQIARAKAIWQLGIDRKDSQLEARGLIRMAFTELDTGKWGKEWEASRDRAVELTKDLAQTAIAKIEVQGHNGYLRAMFFKEIKAGIRDLREAVATSATIENDAFLIRGYFFLGRVLPFDGQDMAALQSLRLSALLAKESNDEAAEFRVTNQLVALSEVVEITPDLATRTRLQELCSRLGKTSSFLMSTDERITAMQKKLEVFAKVRDQPLTEVSRELESCNNAARFLTWTYAQRGEWELAEKYLKVYELCSERMQNESSRADSKFLRAGTLARKGEFARATALMQEFMDYTKAIARSQDLSVSYIWIANQFQAGGDNEIALKWHVLADKSRNTNQIARTSAISATTQFDSLMGDRRLRRQNREQEKQILNQRWILFSLPLAGLCVWLGQRGYRQRRRQKELQALIDKQTDSLRLGKEQAEAQNRAKTEFVARINHEIRNPLTAIVASSELIANDASSQPDHYEARETLRTSTQNLLDLINDVLDFTRIESGKLTAVPVGFSPAELLDSVSAIVRPKVVNGVDLVKTLLPDVPHTLVADKTKIRQVLINLAQNSARHTTSGHVEVRCEVSQTQTESKTTCIRWTVKDSGCGMSSEQLANLFQEYESNHLTGTGLGLFICRAFVDCMDGTIECKSVDGEGTTTTVLIPCGIQQSTPKVQKLSDNASKSRDTPTVLVIDDEPLNRTVLGKLLDKIGYPCEVAATWPEAEVQLKSRQFDVVLLDLRMPNMDGFAVFGEISRLSIDYQPRIYAMTGDATAERRQQVADAGFYGFLAKPFTLAKLKQTVE